MLGGFAGSGPGSEEQPCQLILLRPHHAFMSELATDAVSALQKVWKDVLAHHELTGESASNSAPCGVDVSPHPCITRLAQSTSNVSDQNHCL
eukprot:650561-Rhodomonas_salina.3